MRFSLIAPTLALLGLTAQAQMLTKRADQCPVTKVTLPKLDYGYGDLEPAISRQIMELHHTKHHQSE